MIIENTDLLNKYRENVFFISLILTVVVFPFSEALISIAVGLLLFQAILFQSWKHPAFDKSSFVIVIFPISIFLLYLIGTFFTTDFSLAVYELKKTIFWVIVPLAIFLSPKLSYRRTYIVLFSFVPAVLVASFIFTGKLIGSSYFNITEFRSLSIISHIRFSLQVALSIVLVGWVIVKKKEIPFHINTIFVWFIFLWLVFFLILLKSLLGVIAFLGVVIFTLIWNITGTTDRKRKIGLLILLMLTILIPTVLVFQVVKDYYDFEELDPDGVESYTQSGNPYHHDFEQGIRENGHLVYVYLCEEELRQEWNKRSDIKYDDNLNGYILGSTLIRYLTSKGFRKDSVGISQLNEEDFNLIKKGITNYKFKNHLFSIYPRIYETIWELDYYRRTGDPNGKTLAQRIEFIKASVLLIKKNPVFGIGTGNWVAKYDEAYDLINTKLSKQTRGSSHNQYINYLLKFGIIGTAWILFALVFPVFKTGNNNNYVFIMFLLIYAVANLGDANMETHMGLSFFTFFYAFFLKNSAREMRTPDS